MRRTIFWNDSFLHYTLPKAKAQKRNCGKMCPPECTTPGHAHRRGGLPAAMSLWSVSFFVPPRRGRGETKRRVRTPRTPHDLSRGETTHSMERVVLQKSLYPPLPREQDARLMHHFCRAHHDRRQGRVFPGRTFPGATPHAGRVFWNGSFLHATLSRAKRHKTEAVVEGSSE
jgi:hypothetical protein